MRCFIDTSGFASLYGKNDSHHEEAIQIWNQLVAKNAILLTSRDVIVETIVLLRRREGFDAARTFGEDLWDNDAVEILHSTPREDRMAWDLFKKYFDKEFSFVDCLSFAWMRELRITQAFTFDRDFEKVGYTCLRAH